MKYNFYIQDVDCGNCAAKIEHEISKQSYINSVHIDFMTTKVKVDTNTDMDETDLLTKLSKIADKIESGSKIIKNKVQTNEVKSCACGVDHNHEHEHEHNHSHDHTHEHGHSHGNGDADESKRTLARLIISAVLFLGAILFLKDLPKTIVLFIAYFIIGYDILLRAIKNIMKGQIFDENFLMALATVGALLIGETAEAVTVMLFYQIGEYFQDKAVAQSRKSIASLMDIRPDSATLKTADGLKVVNPEAVQIGDTIVVKPGEKIPLDGTILIGNSRLDMAALTGESMLREVEVGDEVLSGSINTSGVIEVTVSREFGESTVSKILELVENASSNKAPAENFITKFARYYTPAVVAIAAIIAFIVPLILHGAWSYEYIHRALVFLVVSCPCALVISVPLSFFGGIGGASKLGILLKGSNYIELLAKSEAVVFDKTGTLTKGNFAVVELQPEKISKEELVELAAYAEQYSTHPIGKSIVDYYGKKMDEKKIKDVQELAHYGIVATYQDKKLAVGNAKLMEKENINYTEVDTYQTIVYVAYNNQYVGALHISDEIKDDSKIAIQTLQSIGVKDVVMLTGDAKTIGDAVAKELGINHAYTELYPADKVEKVEELKKTYSPVVFVGDGINDAPVLTLADVGVAMGGLGSDAAIEAADIIIMDDKPSKLATAIQIARKTMTIVKQNIVFALAIKAIVLVLGALGYANMWMAVFADVGVSLLAILNAMRSLNVKNM